MRQEKPKVPKPHRRETHHQPRVLRNSAIHTRPPCIYSTAGQPPQRWPGRGPKTSPPCSTPCAASTFPHAAATNLPAAATTSQVHQTSASRPIALHELQINIPYIYPSIDASSQSPVTPAALAPKSPANASSPSTASTPSPPANTSKSAWPAAPFPQVKPVTKAASSRPSAAPIPAPPPPAHACKPRASKPG